MKVSFLAGRQLERNVAVPIKESVHRASHHIDHGTESSVTLPFLSKNQFTEQVVISIMEPNRA
jgi:hypothetical protein